jgi:hypothetical protein
MPPVVEATLRTVRRRLIAFACAEVIATGVLVLLAGVLSGMLADGLGSPARIGWRVTLTGLALGTTVGVLIWGIVLLIRRWPRQSQVAAQIEQAVPDLEERWSTIVELTESHDPPAVRGAAAFFRRVASEAVGLSYWVQPSRFPVRTRIPRLCFATGGLLALLIAAYAIAPTTVVILWERFWNPTSNIVQTNVFSLTGDRVVPLGDPLLLEARTQGRPRRLAGLTIRDANGVERSFDVGRKAASGDDYTYHLRSVRESFQYRWQCGDGTTLWHNVRAERLPVIDRVRLRITPPAYSRLPVQELDALPKQVRALAGSRLEVDLWPSKPLAQLELVYANAERDLVLPAGGGGYHSQKELTESFVFTPNMVDEFGLRGAGNSCRVVVYADAPPVVEIVSPESELTVAPTDTVGIEFKAHDDFGVEAAELVVTRQTLQGQIETTTLPVPLGDAQGAKEVDQKVPLDLKPFHLKTGDQLTYAVRVYDARAESGEGHNVAPSHRSDMLSSTQPANGLQASAGMVESAQNALASEPAERVADSGAENEPGVEPVAQASTQPGEQAVAPQPADQDATSTSVQQADASRSDQKSPVGKSSDEPQDQAGQSTPPPPNEMTKRSLDTGEPSTSSSQQRLKIDEYAGSFEGQAREKLQIAVDAFIQRIREGLTSAAGGTDEMIREEKASAPWGEAQQKRNQQAKTSLQRVEEAVQELLEKSKDTPYAFVGLQLADINKEHVLPARKHLADVATAIAEPEARAKSLESAAHEIARALEQLDAITREYQKYKAKEKREAAVQQLAKMHQVFIEDMANLLKVGKQALNPRDGSWRIIPDEIAEEYRKRVQAALERDKQMMDALARKLAEDPELLRRFMAMEAKSAMSLRDQLTVQAIEQKTLRDAAAAWTDAAKRDEVLKGRRSALLSEAIEIVRRTSALHEGLQTWAPSGMNKEEGPLAEMIGKIGSLAAGMRQLPALAVAEDVKPLQEFVDRALEQLRDVQFDLSELAQEGKETDTSVARFVARRVGEAQELEGWLEDWAGEYDAVRQGKFAQAGAIRQGRLEAETTRLGKKLDKVGANLAKLSPEIAEKASELVAIVNDEVPPKQQEIGTALEQDDLDRAVPAQNQVVESFAKGEKAFDELLDMVEKHAAEQPVGLPPENLASADELLDKLLKSLQDERDAREELGAVINLNLQIMSDWLTKGNGGNGGTGSGANGQAQSPPKAKPAQAQLREALAKALAGKKEAEQLLEQTKEKIPPGQRAGRSDSPDRVITGADGKPPPTQPAGPKVPERDWNVFASTLQDQLRQGAGRTAPEQYRRAIEEYFRQLAEDSRQEKQP